MLLCCKHGIPYLLKGDSPGGSVINVSSFLAGMGAATAQMAYSAAKAAVAQLSRDLGTNLARRGMRVNALAPGPTRTRIANDAFERYPDVIPPIVARTALGRMGDGDDIGKVIAALLSDEWGWVTGENIEASGGFNL